MYFQDLYFCVSVICISVNYIYQFLSCGLPPPVHLHHTVCHRTFRRRLDSWYRHGLMVQTWTLGIDKDSWYRYGLIVLTMTHGIEMDSWYRQQIIVLTWTHGIVSVLLNHTCTRGQSVARMRHFYYDNISHTCHKECKNTFGTCNLRTQYGLKLQETMLCT